VIRREPTGSGEYGREWHALRWKKLVATTRAPNAAAVRALTRSLREREQLDARTLVLAQLALTSAQALDAAVAADTKVYAVANLVRAHGAVLTMLLGVTVTASEDVSSLLVELMSVPVGPMGDAIVTDLPRIVDGKVMPD
jgi:hypothetical protein